MTSSFKPWALVLVATFLLAAGACSKADDGDGGGGSDCTAICTAAAACVDGEDAASVRAGCLEQCGAVPATCLAQVGEACLACFESCDSNCAATACACDDTPGRPGDPCENNYDCEPGSICYNASYCVGTGSLRVTLSFETDSDFDLHVLTPNGYEIYWADRAEDGGELDVDQCVDSCGGGTHVENVVFAETASPGEYQVWVVNFDGRGAGDFHLEVAQGTDAPRSFTGSLPAESDAVSDHFTFTVN